MGLYGNCLQSEEYDIQLEMTLFDEIFNEEVSAEEVNKICNSIQEKYSVLEESAFEEYNQYITEAVDQKENLSKFLKKIGASSSGFMSQIDYCAKQIKNEIKKNGINKTSRANISRYMDECGKNLSEVMGTAKLDEKLQEEAKKKGCYDKSKLRKAIGQVLTCLVLNTLLTVILSLLFTPMLGTKIGAVIVAPIVEETAKQKSIRGGYDKEFFFLFNIYEASSYVLRMTMGGISFNNALIVRIKAAGMHLATTLIQKIMQSKPVMKFFKMDPENDDDKRNASFIGKVIGMIIHGSWNFGATYKNGDNAFTRKLFGKQMDM